MVLVDAAERGLLPTPLVRFGIRRLVAERLREISSGGPYFYEDRGASDRTARHFFTGGVMPCHDLVDQLDEHLLVDERWWIDGRHYAATARAWRRRIERQRAEIVEILGAGAAAVGSLRVRRWRLFLLAVEELFAFRGGAEWGITHAVLRPA